MGALERMKAAGAEMASAAGSSPRPTASSQKDSGSALERMKAAGNERVRTEAASTRPVVEKADSGKAAETSKKERLAALRDEKGRLEAGLDLDGASRVQEEIKKLEKDMGLSFWQRLWNTENGGVKSSAAGMTDATRALYESGQNARTARDTETMAEYNRSLERAKYDMRVMLEENAKAPGTWTDRDLQSQQNIIDDWQRKYDAMAKVSGEQVQQKATQATAQLADTVQESAQKDIETAKKGLGTVGRLAVDAGVAGGQMLGDAAANIVAPGAGLASMAYRGFGSGAQQARLNGATLAQQLGYGAASAGVEVLSEKIFDGLSGIYGGGAADDIVEGVIRKMAKSKNGQRALRVLASGAGEAAEEIIAGAISPALESIYDGKDPLSHYSKETVTDMLHDAAVGGILGGLGGAVSVATGKYKPGGNAQTAQESAQEAAGARIAQQGTVDTAQQKAAAEAATGGNGHGTQTTTGDTLLDAIIKTMQPVTNRQAEAILNDPASASQLGIDTGGMTKSQQREAVKERVAQMQLEVPGEQIYDRGTDPLLQAIVGGISTGQNVENRNSFDSRSGTGYTENTENAALGGEQNGTQLDGAAGEGVRAGTGAVGGREYEKGQGPLGQGDLSNPGVVLVNSETDASGAKIGEASDKAAFSKLLSEARDSDTEHGWSVTPKTEQELADCRIFMREDGTAGLAVKNNGDIEAVFRNKKGAKGAMRSLIPMAIRNGGTKLDCYGKGLARLYGTFGFKPVCRVEFNPEYANPGWDPSKGTPYIYFMVATDTDADSVSRNIGKYGVMTSEELDSLPTFGKDGYDDADSYRNSLMESTIAPGTVGAAAAGFETPGSQSVERTSRLADTSLPYTMRRGEATARTRQEYDEMFRYRSQTEQQSLQAANDMLYYQVDGQPTFLMDIDPESYRAITDSLRLAPAWNAVMGDAAMLIERELMGRSIDGTVSEDVYTEWLTTIREHGTAGGQGVQAMAKWSREDNRNGQRTRADALHNLENSNLSEEDRRQRFQAIIKFDRSIEAAQTDADLRQIILDIARQRGTLSGLTGKQSKLLERIANASLDGMTFEQLKQFAYSSSAALSMDASSVNAGAKLKTVQILNMLSNPKTAAKNIAGNTTFYGLDAMTMRGASLLDMALSKITGTRSVAMESSIFGDRQARADMAKAIRMSLAEITMDVDMGEDNNRYQYGGNRTFKAAGTGAFGTNTAADRFLERVLSACERNMGYLMTTTDEAYKGMARSTQRGTQALVDQGKIKNAGKDYARNQADSLATYRTFQNSGRVAAAIQILHDMFNIVGIGDSGKKFYNKFTIHSFGLGDLVAPFTRVAGNLASVGVDYSPVNAVKGTVEILDTIRNAAMGGEADPSKQAKAVSDFARGMSGTAIAYGVMLLAQAGLVKRAKDEEDEDVASLNRSEGMVGTQVNVDAAKRMLDGGDGTWQTGDTLIDMSNLEPINFIFSLGVELADNGTQGFLSTFGDVNTYKDTYTAIKNAAGDLPVLSGVGDFAKDVLVYNKDPLESGAEMLGKTAISSLTPNSMASLAKGLDDKQRSVYSGDTLTAVLLDTFKSRVPGLRETLPTTVNTLGQEVENPGNQAQRLINAMFNPLGVNQYNQGEVSREMERVRSVTGETGFYPAVRKPATLSYTDKDGKEHEVELDYSQKQQFQAVCGAAQMNLMADMIGSAGYKSSGAARQADLLSDVYRYAYQYAKAGVLGEDSADKWVKNTMSAQKSVGLSPTTVILYRDMLSREKEKSSTKEANSTVRQKIFQDSGLNAAQKGALDDIVISDGIYIPKEVNVDYSSNESFIISQMSEGAQKRYGSISAQFGLDAETYQKAWNIYQDDDLKADEKRAKLYGMGLNGQALYKEFGKKIS